MSSTVACASCNHRFEGGAYRDERCPLCGAVALSTRSCPRCASRLAGRRVDASVIDECTGCGGVFVDHAALELLLREPSRADHLLATLADAANASRTPVAMCPTCGTTMEKRIASGGSGVIIDVCRSHGVFFDPGELHELVAFARREERERIRAEAADRGHARARATDERTVVRAVVDLLLDPLGAAGRGGTRRS